MKLYIDIIIIENFIVNLFILCIVGKLLRLKVRRKKIYISALIGGLYTMVMFTKLEILWSFPMKVFVVILMIKIGFEVNNYIIVLKSGLTFFLVSFMLSGMTFSLSMIQNEYEIGKAFSISNYSIKYILLTVMVMYILIVRIAEYIRDRLVIRNLIYDIYISDNGQEVYLKGFLDTGNELREPVSNLPCIIVNNDCLDIIEMKNDNGYKITYSTIDSYGTLEGFKFEEVKIKNEGNSNWKNIEVIICLSNNRINVENEYQVLLSRGVI